MNVEHVTISRNVYCNVQIRSSVWHFLYTLKRDYIIIIIIIIIQRKSDLVFHVEIWLLWCCSFFVCLFVCCCCFFFFFFFVVFFFFFFCLFVLFLFFCCCFFFWVCTSRLSLYLVPLVGDVLFLWTSYHAQFAVQGCFRYTVAHNIFMFAGIWENVPDMYGQLRLK